MSKSVRVQPGLIVRLIHRISEKNRNRSGLQRYFGATDINLSRERRLEHPVGSLPHIALPSLPDIASLPLVDIPLTAPLATSAIEFDRNQSGQITTVAAGSQSVVHKAPAQIEAPLKPEERLSLEELIQTLDMAGVKVKEVRSLPSGGSCIKIEDLFEGAEKHQYEYVTTGR